MPKLLLAVPVLLVSLAVSRTASTDPTVAAARLAAAARAVLQTLDEHQRTLATFAFDDAERTRWHFVPGEYPGVALSALDLDQARSVHALLSTALSAAGYQKTAAIMQLEDVLRELAMQAGRTTEIPIRDPGRYSLAIFGEPGHDAPWGFRFQGHHLSWNFSSIDGQVAATPAFLGTNPAEIRSGPHAGYRVLGREEDLARALLDTLTPEQVRVAVLADAAPKDVLWGPDSTADVIEEPQGLRHAAMDDDQRVLLMQLIEAYVGNLDAVIAARHRARLRQAGLDDIRFAWLGSTQPGEGHYYRVHGPTFVIEYDCVQDQANHAHAVWHDLTDDFGWDLLRRHHEAAHGGR